MPPLILNDAPAAAGTPDPASSEGLLPRLLTRLLFRQATVADHQPLGAGMHLITLAGPALRGARWRPGDKLKIKLGPGLQTRTYTPIDWDAGQGRTTLLVHALAWGPGSEWVRRAQAGRPVAVFGPRPALDLATFDARAGVLVGDETAIGLAAAWRPAQSIFEAGDRAGVQALVDSLDLPATAITRHTDDLHLDALANAMLGLVQPDSRFVLAGRARTVQHLLRALKHSGVGSERIRTKAYWAEGKAGLD